MNETDDPVTDNRNIKTVTPPPGLDGNPALTKQIFTDKASYFNVSADKKVTIEKEYRGFSKEEWKPKLKNFYDMTAAVKIENTPVTVGFNKRGLNHYLHDLYGDDYVLKNNLIPHLNKLIENGKLVAHERNSVYGSKNANPYKRKISEFFYFEVKLPNKTIAYISVAKFESDYRLYAISERLRETAELY